MDDTAVCQARILIVDDQEPNVLLLGRLLKASGFTDVASTTNSADAVALCAAYEPDLVLLDLRMPPPDGFEVMRQLEPWTRGQARLPILVLSADQDTETKRQALSTGASDFLNKPFDATEAILRIRNLLSVRLLQLELRDQNASLEQRVHTRTRELEEARIEIIERLARAAEYRDDNTGKHAERVGRTSALIGRQIGLPDATVELIRLAAPLHDVGKLAIPDSILLKPAKLTAEQFWQMQAHAQAGAKLLSDSGSEVLRLAEEIARTHHERWDGSGYPANLSGEEIPISGRIVAVADVYDALTHVRPYKEAWPIERAVREMHTLRGRHFDPEVIEAFDKLDPFELAGVPTLPWTPVRSAPDLHALAS